MAAKPSNSEHVRRLAQQPDAAAYAGGVHPRTIRRMIARGDLTGYRFGRKILVDLDEIDAMLRPIPTTGTGPSASTR